jgi:FkbM family methyltransferase
MIVETKFGFSLNVRDGSYIGAQLLQHGVWESAETDLVRSLVRPGDLVIDAGAHVGYYSLLMAHAGARVLAFEPNPELFKLLYKNSAELDIKAYQVALSDVDGEADFFLPSGYDDGFGSLGAADRDDRSRSIRVETKRLDGVLSPGRVRLMKLDVEGAEACVIRGLGARFTDVDHYLIECIDRPVRVQALESSVDIINTLLSNFEVLDCQSGGEWKRVAAARSSPGPSILFVNPMAER